MSSYVVMLSGRCLDAIVPLGPPMRCRIPQLLIVLPLLCSIVGRHDSPPKFGETRIHGLPRPDHPDTLDIDKAFRRLLVLPELVLELNLVVSGVFPRDFLVADLVVSELVPPTPSATRVVVSELGPPLVGSCWSFCPEIPPPPGGKPRASVVSRRVFSLARPLGRSSV